MHITRFLRRFGTPFALTAALTALLAATGCEGPQGPPGEGVTNLDTTPPEIAWYQPERSDTVFVDTFTVQATASDNRHVLYVEFFLDGTSTLAGDTVAIDSTAPYRFTWDLARMGRGVGTYPIIARAFDDSYNSTDTPPLLITRAPLPPTELLYYYGRGDFLTMHLPDRYGDRYFNVRFTPYDSCRVEQVQFKFADPTQETTYGDNPESFVGGCDFYVYLWRSNDQGLPLAASADSVLVPYDSVNVNDWTVVDVSGMDSTVYAGDFNAGFSPLPDQYQSLYDSRLCLPLVVQMDPDPLADPSQHRSSELEAGGLDPSGWGTVQSHWNNQKRDLLIRVLISYGDGSTALLAPDGSHVTDDRDMTGGW